MLCVNFYDNINEGQQSSKDWFTQNLTYDAIGVHIRNESPNNLCGEILDAHHLFDQMDEHQKAQKK